MDWKSNARTARRLGIEPGLSDIKRCLKTATPLASPLQVNTNGWQLVITSVYIVIPRHPARTTIGLQVFLGGVSKRKTKQVLDIWRPIVVLAGWLWIAIETEATTDWWMPGVCWPAVWPKSHSMQPFCLWQSSIVGETRPIVQSGNKLFGSDLDHQHPKYSE